MRVRGEAQFSIELEWAFLFRRETSARRGMRDIEDHTRDVMSREVAVEGVMQEGEFVLVRARIDAEDFSRFTRTANNGGYQVVSRCHDAAVANSELSNVQAAMDAMMAHYRLVRVNANGTPVDTFFDLPMVGTTSPRDTNGDGVPDNYVYLYPSFLRVGGPSNLLTCAYIWDDTGFVRQVTMPTAARVAPTRTPRATPVAAIKEVPKEVVVEREVIVERVATPTPPPTPAPYPTPASAAPTAVPFPVPVVPPVPTAPEVLDQSFLATNTTASVAGQFFGQSFTAGKSGNLTKIGFNIIEVFDPSTGGFEIGTVATLRVFDNGITQISPIGPQVHTQQITQEGGWREVTLSKPVSVTAGQVYTFQVETMSTMRAPISSEIDLYISGRALSHARHDIPFKTWVAATDWGPAARPIPTVPPPVPPQLYRTESGLQIKDLVVGTGEQARAGAIVLVHYTGWLLDGTKFDSSVDRGKPFEFKLGQARVIKGWDEGVANKRVGGKRELTIPPELAYGDQGAGDRIKPGATLVFEIELLEVKEP